MHADERRLTRRDAVAILGLCATSGIASRGIRVRESSGGSPPPFRLWTWDEPIGASQRDPRIRPLVRVAVDSLRPEDAAGRVGMRTMQSRLAPGDVAVLLQNFGMGGGPPDGAAWRRTATTALFAHPADGLADGSCEAPWITPWFSQGIRQSAPWFRQFAEQLANACSKMPALAPPTRFHFDSEEWPQVVASARGGVGAFLAAMLDRRWSVEPIEGFGEPLSVLWERGGRLTPDRARTWFDPVNREWACWYQGILFSASSAALAAAVGSTIESLWPSCLWSNYVLSSSFDGVDDRYDVDPRNPWLKTIHRGRSSMQAPNLYPVASAWGKDRGLPPTQASLEFHRIALGRIEQSFGGTPPTRICPWIEGIQERVEGGDRLVSDAAYFQGALGLAQGRGIVEALLWNDPGSCTPAFWAGLPGLIDGALRP
ncbi:MAG: hypothetical protein RLZ94_1624 [Actinomycetota bacterium]|jgi:hypothetical protein